MMNALDESRVECPAALTIGTKPAATGAAAKAVDPAGEPAAATGPATGVQAARAAGAESEAPSTAKPFAPHAAAVCAICGARLQLADSGGAENRDPHAPYTFYCDTCLQRAGQHKRIIKEAGWKREEPRVE